MKTFLANRFIAYRTIAEIAIQTDSAGYRQFDNHGSLEDCLIWAHKLASDSLRCNGRSLLFGWVIAQAAIQNEIGAIQWRTIEIVNLGGYGHRVVSQLSDLSGIVFDLDREAIYPERSEVVTPAPTAPLPLAAVSANMVRLYINKIGIILLRPSAPDSYVRSPLLRLTIPQTPELPHGATLQIASVGLTIDDLAKAAGLDCYDCALPMGWVRSEYLNKGLEFPIGVWNYPINRTHVFGSFYSMGQMLERIAERVYSLLGSDLATMLDHNGEIAQ